MINLTLFCILDSERFSRILLEGTMSLQALFPFLMNLRDFRVWVMSLLEE